MLSSPTEKLNEWVEKHSMSFDARGLLHATPKDADGRCWHNPAAPADSQWVRLLRYRGPSMYPACVGQKTTTPP